MMNQSHSSSGVSSSSGDNDNHAAKIQKTMESKVHDYFATQRRHRDEMQRAHARAKECHTVLQQQKEAAEKAAHFLQTQLEKDKEQVNGKAEENLRIQRAENQKLEQEYNFQHSELTNKRNKLAHMKRAMEQAALDREQKLLKEIESIRWLQSRHGKKEKKNNSASTSATMMTPKLAMELIQVEFSGGVSDDERMWQVWAKLVEEKAEEMAREANERRHSIQELENILQGYKNHFGLKLNDHVESSNSNSNTNASPLVVVQSSSRTSIGIGTSPLTRDQ